MTIIMIIIIIIIIIIINNNMYDINYLRLTVKNIHFKTRSFISLRDQKQYSVLTIDLQNKTRKKFRSSGFSYGRRKLWAI